MAVHKRSLPLAALGIVAGNVGLWVLWHQCGLASSTARSFGSSRWPWPRWWPSTSTAAG